MEDSLAERFLRDERTFWLTGAWICILFLTTNLPWHLDDYDQAKPAFSSFEMVHEGHWLYQRMPLDPVAQKPPFFGWVSTISYELTRWWDLAWRLPSLLSALAISILLLRAASLAYGRTAGLISLGAFGFNLLSARLATLVTTDMLLALSIFLAGLLIWQKIRSGNAWNSRDRWWFFGLLTMSLFIKGPVVYAFLLLGIAAFAWRKRSDEVTSAWAGTWPWLGSLAVFLAWVTGGILFKPGFYDQVVMREFLGRFSRTVHQPQPVYFYLPHLLGYRFMPWSALMILLAIVCRTRGRVREALRSMPADIFWLICWSLGGLIVMSLVPSKRVDRIFPVVPPLCLLLGAQVGLGLTAQEIRGRVYQWSGAALLFAFLFTTGYSLWKVVPGYLYQRDALVTFSRAVRQEAARYHWRYEVVLSQNWNGTEGMLLYLQKPHFFPLDKAVEEWNGGKIQALVIPEDQVSPAMAALRQANIAPLRTSKRKDLHAPSYVLVTRGQSM
jgi:4-amino-4-deoxy-L-arabinose transferase-like glycosyltransferase